MVTLRQVPSQLELYETLSQERKKKWGQELGIKCLLYKCEDLSLYAKHHTKSLRSQY